MNRSKKAGVHGRIFAEMVSLSRQIKAFSLAGFDCARAAKTERADDAKRDMERGARASEIGAASLRGIEKVMHEERERMQAMDAMLREERERSKEAEERLIDALHWFEKTARNREDATRKARKRGLAMKRRAIGTGDFLTLLI